MEMVTQILTQLGVKSELFYYQLAVFAISFFILFYGVFIPFAKAHNERVNRTKGSEADADDFLKKKAELYVEFETKARDVNEQIKTIYDEYRSEANKEYEKIVSDAKGRSAAIIGEAKLKIQEEIKIIQGQIKEQAPALAKQINNKILKKA